MNRTHLNRNKTVLVTGASGFVGRNLVSVLRENGYDVVAWNRKQKSHPEISDGRVQIYAGDLTDTSAENMRRLEEAVRSSDIVVHLAAKTSQDPSTPELSESANVGVTERLIALCKKSEGKKFIFMSTQSAKIGRAGSYGASKKKAEDLVLSSGLDTAIFRPAIIYGAGEAGLFKKFVGIVQKFPVIPVPASAVLFQPVFVGDVAQAILSCIERGKFSGRIYDVAGPDAVTFPQLIQMVARALGLKRVLIPFPMQLALWAATLLAKLLPKPPVTVDNLIGLTEATLLDLSPLRDELGIRPLSLPEGLHRALA